MSRRVNMLALTVGRVRDTYGVIGVMTVVPVSGSQNVIRLSVLAARHEKGHR